MMRVGQCEACEEWVRFRHMRKAEVVSQLLRNQSDGDEIPGKKTYAYFCVVCISNLANYKPELADVMSEADAAKEDAKEAAPVPKGTA